MRPSPTTRCLKRGLHRAVYLRPGADGGPVVVKLYRSRGALRRLGDRRRARRELGLLRELHAAGAPVPRPLELGRDADGWALAMAPVQDARSLAELLEQPGLAPAPAEALARELGRAVGRAHALGLRHGDLHGGNLLVDAHGAAWVVDLAAARRVSPGETRRLRGDLVDLLADTIERAPRGALARFVVAWLAEQPAAERGRWRASDLRSELLGQARLRRREALLRNADRWTRESGLCSLHDTGGGPLLVARDAGRSPTELERRIEALAGGAEERDPTLVLDAAPGAAERWVRVGLARQHALPALAPLALRLARGREAALYRAPEGALPAERPGPGVPLPLDRDLAERGLAPESRGLWRTGEGHWLLGPGCALVAEAPR
jgi:tRNA A-37 threonylcarbamoyl transferase component Bud32